MRNKNAKVSDPNSFVSNCGDQYHIIYGPIIRDDGSIELVEQGKDDIQEMIESYKDSTDMAYIIKRLSLGDTSVLNQSKPMYGDFTVMPKTYAEALQLVIDAESKFMKLPLDVRNSFDNDYRKWFASSGSDSWFEKMAPVLPELGSVKPGSDDVSEVTKE